MSCYEYSPLPQGRHFRLLQIMYRNPDVDTIITGAAATTSTSRPELSVDLKTFPLDETPPYWTLSYTWGPSRSGPNGEEPDAGSQTTVMIMCDGAPIQIGENLYDFLCHSRDRDLFISSDSVPGGSTITPVDPFHNARPPNKDAEHDHTIPTTAYVWVDQLCINQESPHERSQQVALMSTIYSRCGRVLVWLGRQPAPPEAIWAIELFLPAFLHDLDARTHAALARSTLDFEDDELVDSLGAEVCVRWRASYPELFTFLARTRWFTRGWTVQEALLKDSSDVIMLCGPETFRLDSFLALMTVVYLGLRRGSVSLLQRKLSSVDKEGPSLWDKTSSRLNALDRLRKVGRLIYSPNPSKSMTKWQRVLKLVTDMGSSSFQDSRDRVFGCLGLIKAIVPEADLESILPDYTLQASEVLTAFARLLYENIYELEYIFSLAGFNPESENGLPAWAPDFARPTRRTALIALGILGNSQGSYNASKLFPVPQCQARVDGKTLVLTGARLGIVDELVEIQKPRCFSAEWLFRYCNQDGIYAQTGQEFAEAVILTLSVDNAHHRRQQSQRSHSDGAAGHVAVTAQAWYLQVIAIMQRRGLIPEASLDTLSAAARRHPEWLPNADEVRDAVASITKDNEALMTLRQNEWDYQMTLFIDKRRLFLTKDGLLCLGPELAQSGDEVWIVRGSRVPVLLRKNMDGNGYNLIGETYVHGVMYGEAVTKEFQQQFALVSLM